MNRFLLAALVGPLATAAFAADVPDLAPQRAAAMALAQQLGAELKKEVADNGPERAIAVCKDLAPRIAGELSRKEGWKLVRVSLKPRNPMLGMPDAWEQQALHQLEARVAAGEKPERLEVAEVVHEPAGPYLRYLKAIPVQSECLACHGAADEMKPEIRARLAELYPFDRATGYAVGMLRGGISIKQPLGEALVAK